ncbi:hypothetical protein I6A60_31075 [Frankia sp. AgB1.9]|uniref:hypothetical protein n=1 Tax=unclassified Frankia TaxID=2632575 RepID=UPI001931CAD3|nr:MULTISPECIES: hypothetical protein [unclassified Frankia]MBL7493956.1 hypothetical protein [Frankia sp. AgW1.1]MBL7552272.1 hypothetical protein [Frankia sp. AgB1.9]MBL7625567.1 hypothetical protein [Frankia sp. AgB1.8]
MPCYRCDTRQTDPVRGTSPWARGVVGGEQVLVCPDCQRDPDWRRPLNRCAGCGSAHLSKALGLVVCRDCGSRTDPASRPALSTGLVATDRAVPPGAPQIPAPAREPGLADPAKAVNAALAVDVGAALDRMFGRATNAAPSPDDLADR